MYKIKPCEYFQKVFYNGLDLSLQPPQLQGAQTHALSLMLCTLWLSGRMTGHRKDEESEGRGFTSWFPPAGAIPRQTRGLCSRQPGLHSSLLPGCHHCSLPSSWGLRDDAISAPAGRDSCATLWKAPNTCPYKWVPLYTNPSWMILMWMCHLLPVGTQIERITFSGHSCVSNSRAERKY